MFLSGAFTLLPGPQDHPVCVCWHATTTSRVQRGTRASRGEAACGRLGLGSVERSPNRIILETPHLGVRYGPNLTRVIHDDDPHEIVFLAVVDDSDGLAACALLRDE